MVRLKDIAEQAAVSIMTVSKALRDEPDVSAATKARIKLLARQMGYVPDSTAQGLRNRTTRLFGLAVPSVTDPVFARAVLAVQEQAQELGYDLLVANTLNQPEREEACVHRFLSRRVDGIFLCPVYRLETEAPLYQELLRRSQPTVLLGPAAPFCSQFPNVETDDVSAAEAVTTHLLSLGHRRIAFLGGPQSTPWHQKRFEGYRRGLRAAGLDIDDKLVFQAGQTVEDGAKAAAQMLAESTPATAIQAVNDSVAIGCAEILLERGLRLPGDLSLAGFGNTLIAEHFRVPLTTIRQPKYRLGLAAMAAMRQLLLGQKPDTKPLPAELVVRASTGAVPKASVLSAAGHPAQPIP